MQEHNIDPYQHDRIRGTEEKELFYLQQNFTLQTASFKSFLVHPPEQRYSAFFPTSLIFKHIYRGKKCNCFVQLTGNKRSFMNFESNHIKLPR